MSRNENTIMSPVSKSLLFCLTSLVVSAPALAERMPQPLSGHLQAQVQHVDDGDTLAVLAGGIRHKVRLSDIDAPEMSHCKTPAREKGCSRPGQPFSAESRQALLRLVGDGRVDLVCSDYDSRYSRSVCRVYAGGVDVNAAMVRQGMAWFNPKYSRDTRLRRAQDEAKSHRQGLWRDASPVAPWVWRDLCWKHAVCQ